MGAMDAQVALVTGAGSGIGRAIALTLAQAGYAVTLNGRTRRTLEETAALLEERSVPAGRVWVAPCDVTDPAAVQGMVDGIVGRFGRLDVLVNNAGVNVPNRALDGLSIEDWQYLVRTNLDGAFFCVHAALPLMRRQGAGLMIHIGSQAARRPSALPGAAYTAAKAGLWGLNAVINAEERRNGIRSSLIILGDVNTPLLDHRPEPPGADERETAVQPDDVAACVALIVSLPPRATIEELALLPTARP